MKREREEGKQEGLSEGKKIGLIDGKRDFVLKLFTKTYPQEETGFLENLTKEQYEKIFELLIEKADLEKVYQVVKDDIEK